MRLSGRRALVTGAATGIGAATVERFEREGAEVVGIDAAPGYDGIVADVSNRDDVAAAVREAGELDICVANAGVSRMESFVEGDPEAWRRLLDVNLLGVMLTFQAAVRAMPRGGHLLVTSSIAGLRGEPSAAAYCASKAGVIGLVRSLAAELAPRRISVNAAAPGQIETAMNLRDLETQAEHAQRHPEDLLREHLERRVPAGRMGTPDEVAAAFAYLASDEARFVTGQVLVIDGGESIA